MTTRKKPTERSPETLELYFALRSLDPTQRAARLFATIKVPLENDLASHLRGAKAEVEAAKNFPEFSEVWHFVIRVAGDPVVQEGLKKGLVTVLTTMVLEWFKSRSKNVSVTPLPAPVPAPRPKQAKERASKGTKRSPSRSRAK